MARVEVEVHEALGSAERGEVQSLLQAATGADGSRPLSDQQWLALAGIPERASAAAGSARRTVAILARDGAGGPLAGYAQLVPGHDAWALEAVVHPGHPTPGSTVDEPLLRAALGQVARESGGDVRLWLRAPEPGTRAMAARLGFAVERELHQLRVPLPLAQARPAGAATPVRQFVPGQDEQAWLVTNNRAFAAHPDQGRWGVDDLRQREHEPWFDPQGFLLHEQHGRLAAFCWTKVHLETRPALGEIYVIGVDPDFQGHGLGRALAVAGLDHLARRGIQVGMLYVDGDNGPALGLYRSLGFAVHDTDVAFRKRVDPVVASRRPTPP